MGVWGMAKVNPSRLAALAALRGRIAVAAHSMWSKLLRFRKATRSKKVVALKESQSAAIRAPREKRRNMKTSTKDKIKGSFHEVAGTIKEGVGKVANDRNLTDEGKAEKKEGKVQQKIGHAKEAVADLKDKLAELKTR
jgi:uncharacterized protein YjbJ (UPF0337 family)